MLWMKAVRKAGVNYTMTSWEWGDIKYVPEYSYHLVQAGSEDTARVSIGAECFLGKVNLMSTILTLGTGAPKTVMVISLTFWSK